MNWEDRHMKAATKLLMRRAARAREVEVLRSLRSRETVADDPYLRQQLPLSLAPYRLQAADRWWRETGSPANEQARKRHA
jgi:hypothetical protein